MNYMKPVTASSVKRLHKLFTVYKNIHKSNTLKSIKIPRVKGLHSPRELVGHTVKSLRSFKNSNTKYKTLSKTGHYTKGPFKGQKADVGGQAFNSKYWKKNLTNKLKQLRNIK